MLKREITYEDFNGEKVTGTYYFNQLGLRLSNLRVAYEGGLESSLKRIIETKDNRALVNEFKRIVLLAYGVRSEDGKRFIKSDKLREEFSQTAAYDELFMELASDDDAAANFIKESFLPSYLRELRQKR